MQEKLRNWIKEMLQTEALFVVEHPDNLEHGDFSTNVALVTRIPAREIVATLRQAQGDLQEQIERIEIAGPGFINFHLSKKFFEENVENISEQKEKFGRSGVFRGDKIIIEYTNTNVLKPMHIGHLMGNVIGQSLSNILEESGALVKRNTYQGDVGLHIAKAIWGINKLGGKIEGTISEKANYIGRAYAEGSNAYEDDAIAQEEIKEINKKIYERNDKELLDIYNWGREISLSHMQELYKKLGTTFDYYFCESEVGEDAIKIVKEYLTKGVFEESDGAIVFKGEKYDPKLHTRVFVTNLGLPTYEAKDIAHALRKERTYSADKSIIITASEQDQYFKVVLKALEQIDPDVAHKTKHLSHGMLNLSTGKMSSRKGNIITGEALINDIEDMVREKIKDRDFSEDEKSIVAEEVAIGAIKYSILRQAVGGDIVFDFDKSISFEGDSGPYLQYTAVRAKSVLEKAVSCQLSGNSKMPEGWQVTNLEKYLYRFPEIVERAAREYAPHYIVTYLLELSGIFNNFYANEKIVVEGDPASPYKLALTQAAMIVLQNGLRLLGIKVPEKM
jgi:arginyl-tRNA synthetase